MYCQSFYLRGTWAHWFEVLSQRTLELTFLGTDCTEKGWAQVVGDSKAALRKAAGCFNLFNGLMFQLQVSVPCYCGAWGSREPTEREGSSNQSPSLVLNWESAVPDLITAGNTLLKDLRNAKSPWVYLVICGIFSWSVYCRPVLENLKDRAKLHSLQFLPVVLMQDSVSSASSYHPYYQWNRFLFGSSWRTFLLAIYYGQLWERIIPLELLSPRSPHLAELRPGQLCLPGSAPPLFWRYLEELQAEVGVSCLSVQHYSLLYWSL